MSMREALAAAGLGQRHPHAVNVRQRNAGVLAAIGAQHRRLQVPDRAQYRARLQLAGLAAQLPVPGSARAQLGIVRGVEPDLASAPAKPQDAQSARVAAMLGGPGRCGVQVALHLRVGHLADDFRLQLGNIGVARRVALAREQLGRHRQIPQVRQAAADILDVLVHAEYLGHHQQRGQVLLALRRGAIGRHLAVGHRNVHPAGQQAGGVGGYRRLRHRLPRRQRKSRRHRRGDEARRSSFKGGSKLSNCESWSFMPHLLGRALARIRTKPATSGKIALHTSHFNHQRQQRQPCHLPVRHTPVTHTPQGRRRRHGQVAPIGMSRIRLRRSADMPLRGSAQRFGVGSSLYFRELHPRRHAIVLDAVGIHCGATMKTRSARPS